MADHKEELSNFSEEVLGVNFRSFKTIRDLILQPNKVVQDFHKRDRSYTPTLRLALFFSGIYLAFLYFIGGYEQIFMDGLQSNPDGYKALVEKHGEDTLMTIAKKSSSLLVLSMPILTVLSYLPSIWILKSFEKEPSFGTRINLVFGALSVAILASIIVLISSILFSFDNFQLWAGIISICVGGLTFFRGAKGLLYESVGDGLSVTFIFLIVTTFFSVILSLIFVFSALLLATYFTLA